MKKTIPEKIAFLITTMGYGSQLLYWEPILSHFVANASSTRIYMARGKKVEQNQKLPVCAALRLYRITLSARNISSYNRVITLIDPRILLNVWRYNPRILVLSEFGLLTMYGLLVAMLRPRCRILLLVESDPGKIGAFRTLIRRIFCKAADFILTNNTAGQQYLLNTLKVPLTKIQKSPYLVSQPGQANADNQESYNAISQHPFFTGPHLKFIYVGQIAKRKGISCLIKAMAALPSDYRDSIQVAIVGGGDASEKHHLNELLHQEKLEKHFHFMGRRSYSELEYFYENSDVFVFPTLNDYRALVGFEAISKGLPVLMSRYDGASEEVVDEGRNGFVFDPQDTGEFTNKLIWFVDNRGSLQQLAEHSKEISRDFTIEISANNLTLAVAKCIQSDRTAR